MTLHEKVVLSTYTGILMCDFSEVHKYIEKLLSWLRRPYGRRSRKKQNPISSKSSSRRMALYGKSQTQGRALSV